MCNLIAVLPAGATVVSYITAVTKNFGQRNTNGSIVCLFSSATSSIKNNNTCRCVQRKLEIKKKVATKE